MNRWERLLWKILAMLLILQVFLTAVAVERAADRAFRVMEPFTGVSP